MTRRSYRGLMSFPAWGIYNSDNGLVATIRAATIQDAAEILKRHGFKGEVRKING